MRSCSLDIGVIILITLHTYISLRISFSHYDTIIVVLNGRLSIGHFLRLKKRYIWVSSVNVQRSKDTIFGQET